MEVIIQQTVQTTQCLYDKFDIIFFVLPESQSLQSVMTGIRGAWIILLYHSCFITRVIQFRMVTLLDSL